MILIEKKIYIYITKQLEYVIGKNFNDIVFDF